VQGERFAVEVLMILLGLGIPSIWSFYLCWIIKTFKSTSVVKMRSSVSPKKREIIKIIKPKIQVNLEALNPQK
jgi:hypothetical protein